MGKKVKDLKVGDKIFAIFEDGHVSPYDIIKCNLLSADGYYRIHFKQNYMDVNMPCKTSIHGEKTTIPYYDYTLYLDIQEVIESYEKRIKSIQDAIVKLKQEKEKYGNN